MLERRLYYKQFLVLALLILLQTTFMALLAIDMYVPDILLLWVVYIALRFGQIEATIAGCVAGFFEDILATHLLGLATLTKTLTGFVCGYFYNENMIEQTLSSPRFISMVAVLAFFHNLLYFFIFYQGVHSSVFTATLESSMASTLYTTLVSVLPFFYFAQKFRTGWIRS